MAEYIDLKDIQAFPIRIDHYDEEHGKRDFVLGIECLMEFVESLPTIDIVRCENCKWYDKVNAFCDYWADIYEHAEQYPRHTPVDYCSRGERKESEDAD